MPATATAPASIRYDALELADKQLLALVAAHADASARSDAALAWNELLAYTAELAATDEPNLAQSLSSRALPRQLSLLVNRLLESSLLSASSRGLALTNDAAAMRAEWNGDFARLVERASRVVSSGE